MRELEELRDSERYWYLDENNEIKNSVVVEVKYREIDPQFEELKKQGRAFISKEEAIKRKLLLQLD